MARNNMALKWMVKYPKNFIQCEYKQRQVNNKIHKPTHYTIRLYDYTIS